MFFFSNRVRQSVRGTLKDYKQASDGKERDCSARLYSDRGQFCSTNDMHDMPSTHPNSNWQTHRKQSINAVKSLVVDDKFVASADHPPNVVDSSCQLAKCKQQENQENREYQSLNTPPAVDLVQSFCQLNV